MSKKITWHDLPTEIQQRMLDCQEEQGLPKDETVFEQDQTNGFDFADTKEGFNFWHEILTKGNIDHFYTLYPKFQPIAMKCTQEQWDELKPELVKLEVGIIDVFNFDIYPYLVNNYDNSNRVISNCLSRVITNHNRTVHETFNKQIFLDSLGFKVETETPTLPALPYGAELICKEMEVSNDEKTWVEVYVVFKDIDGVLRNYFCFSSDKASRFYRFAREIDPQRKQRKAKINELEKQIAEMQETVNKLKAE